ncbi:MAG: hypothetical protein ABSF47_00850 [Minisyncoccia bacterium]|jgi:hypothetical protein
MHDTGNEEYTSIMFSPIGGEFGKNACKTCFRSLDDVLEGGMRAGMAGGREDKQELLISLMSVDGPDEESKKKQKLSLLLSWLNKGKKHDEIVRCPECHGILQLDEEVGEPEE